MLCLIILLISFLLDGILTNFLAFMPNNLSYFTPLLTLTSIIVIYPLYRKKEKKYFTTIIILGLLYDLFYTNLLFLNAILFFMCGLIIKFIYKNIDYSFIKIILLTILIIVIYESLTALIIVIFNLVPMSLTRLSYKILHSLLLNIIYACVCYGIIKIMPSKYKKIQIN